MKNILLITLFILTFGSSMSVIFEAGAQSGWGLEDATSAESKYMPKTKSGGESVSNSVVKIIQSATNALTMIVASIAILFTIINGFLIVTSTGGDRLAKAKKGLLWSLAGLMMVIFAYIITKSVIALVYTL